MLIHKRIVDGRTVWELTPPRQRPPQPFSPTIRELFDWVADQVEEIRPVNFRLTPYRPRRRRKVNTRFGPHLTRRQYRALCALAELRALP